MAVPNQGQEVASAWEAKVGTKPTDNVHNSYWLLKLWSENGGAGFKGIDGGRKLEISIEYALNTTFKSYDDLEPLDTTRIDVFDCAQYDWKQVAGTMVISEKEKAFTQGSGGKFDLLAAKLENAKNSHDYELNRQLYLDGTGNGGKDISGLALLVPASPVTGTVGGINRATYSWWRSQQNIGTLVTVSGDRLRSGLTTCYNNCSKGMSAEHPDAIVMSQTVFNLYESLLVAIEQITASEKNTNADIAFKNDVLKFKGAKMSFDEGYTTTSTAHVLNTNFLKLYYQRGYWKKMFPAVDPANQTADVYKILTIAQMGLSASRRQGIVTVIT